MELDNLQTLFGIFSQWRFHIPDYQRGYAWGKPQWDDLLEDLSTLTENNEHFTGLLVLHENRDQKLAVKTRGICKPVFDIVDGQQRLTTIVILLNEIQREMTRLDGNGDLQEIAKSIVDTYLYEPAAGNLLASKLILDTNNNAFFVRNILELDGKDLQGARIQSHKNLEGARQYFSAYLQANREQLQEKYVNWLEILYHKIANQMKVMIYRLRSEADAGVVFESMNNRGKKPNSLDLVKNYLLYLASKLGSEATQKLTEDINRAWTVIFEQLNTAGRTDAEDTLLQMHWLAIYDYDLKRWKRDREKADIIKKRFQLVHYLGRYDELFQDLEIYIQTLQNTVVAFADISNPERSNAFQIFENTADIRGEIVKYSLKLIRLGVLRPITPLLIAARLRFPDDGQKYLEVVKACEIYAVRVFRIAGRRSSSSEAFLFRLANQFYHQRITFSTLLENLQRDLLEKCSDELFIKRFALDDPNPWYGRSSGLVKYFLYEYEEHLFGDQAPIINWSTIHEGNEKTIEHILPQHPEEMGYWVDQFPSQEAGQMLTHVLGNLTLTEDNSKLGRKSFPLKQGRIGQEDACYANSNLKIERELAGIEGDWTPDQIEQRQQRLAKWALERWHVEPVPPLPPQGLEALRQIAERNSFLEEFDRIRGYAKRIGLGEKANKQCMSYKPTYNWNLTAISVYTYSSGISIILNFKHFPKGLKLERIQDVFENNTHWWLSRDRIEDFFSRLEQLAAEVESNS
jgi:uncharacterized protein with ParB-like and HNH nuclease domain